MGTPSSMKADFADLLEGIRKLRSMVELAISGERTRECLFVDVSVGRPWYGVAGWVGRVLSLAALDPPSRAPRDRAEDDHPAGPRAGFDMIVAKRAALLQEAKSLRRVTLEVPVPRLPVRAGQTGPAPRRPRDSESTCRSRVDNRFFPIDEEKELSLMPSPGGSVSSRPAASTHARCPTTPFGPLQDLRERGELPPGKPGGGAGEATGLFIDRGAEQARPVASAVGNRSPSLRSSRHEWAGGAPALPAANPSRQPMPPAQPPCTGADPDIMGILDRQSGGSAQEIDRDIARLAILATRRKKCIDTFTKAAAVVEGYAKLVAAQVPEKAGLEGYMARSVSGDVSAATAAIRRLAAAPTSPSTEVLRAPPASGQTVTSAAAACPSPAMVHVAPAGEDGPPASQSPLPVPYKVPMERVLELLRETHDATTCGGAVVAAEHLILEVLSSRVAPV